MVKHLIIKPVKSKNQDSILNEDFDSPFGKFDRMWPMVIGVPCDWVQVGPNLKHFRNEIPYLAKFFVSHTNFGLINFYLVVCDSSSKVSKEVLTVQHNHRNYNELSLGHVSVDKKLM